MTKNERKLIRSGRCAVCGAKLCACKTCTNPSCGADCCTCVKKVRVGDVVWLRANAEEGWSREQVKVLSIERRGVLLVEALKHGRDEDGMLEITEDQIES